MRRVEWALRRHRRVLLRQARELREDERWLLKAARRVIELPGTYDSEDEEENGGLSLAGLLGRRWQGEPVDGEPSGIPTGYEPDDLGEEAETWSKILRRTQRRLNTWDGNVNFHAYNTHVSRPLDVDLLPPPPASKALTNGTRKASRKRPRSPEETVRLQDDAVQSPDVPPGGRERDLNDEITQDLLAERSDEDMDADDFGDGEGDGDVDSDVDMD